MEIKSSENLLANQENVNLLTAIKEVIGKYLSERNAFTDEEFQQFFPSQARSRTKSLSGLYKTLTAHKSHTGKFLFRILFSQLNSTNTEQVLLGFKILEIFFEQTLKNSNDLSSLDRSELLKTCTETIINDKTSNLSQWKKSSMKDKLADIIAHFSTNVYTKEKNADAFSSAPILQQKSSY